MRESRDSEKVDAALAQLLTDAKMGKNVMPALVRAVKTYATVGEMTNCMVEAFGRYDAPIKFD